MSEIKKFQVFKSVGEVFSGVTRHYFELIWVAPLPVVAYAIASIALGAFLMPAAAQDGMSQKEISDAMIATMAVNWKSIVPLIFLLTLTGFAAAVRWHRFVLIGEHGGPLWNQTQTRYAWTAIKMSLALTVMFIILAMFVATTASGVRLSASTVLKIVVFTVMAAAFVFMLLWIVRVSLAFPDAAMGGAGKIGDAYRRTAGNSWRLLGYVLVMQVIVGFGYKFAILFVGVILKALFAAAVPGLVGQEQFATSTILLPLSIYALMLSVTMLSVAYREIIGLPQVPGGQ